MAAGADRLAVTVVAGGAEAHVLAAGLAGHLAPEGVALIGPSGPVAPGTGIEGVSSVAVAPATGYRSVGCECCSMRVDVIDALGVVLDRRCRPRRAVVVTHHDVVGATQTLLSDPWLRRWTTLDGVVATCDGPALSTRQATGGALGTEAELATLATADVVVVTASERLSDGGVRDLKSALRAVNRTGRVVAPRAGAEPFGSLVDLGAWRGRLRQVSSQRHPVVAANVPATVVLETDGHLDAEGVRTWLDGVLDEHAPRLLRLQGELCVHQHERAVDCVAIRSFLSTTGGRTLPASRSHVSLIGWGLDAGELLTGVHRLVRR